MKKEGDLYMEYTANNDPKYYESNCAVTNCGSFALRLKEWYDNEVDEYFGGIDQWCMELLEEGIPDDDIPDMIAETYIDRIIKDFEGSVRLLRYLDRGSLLKAADRNFNEELIAFRTYVPVAEWDPECEYLEFDFHFMVYRDGRWMEKNGNGAVHECSVSEWGKYNSSTFLK